VELSLDMLVNYSQIRPRFFSSASGMVINETPKSFTKTTLCELAHALLDRLGICTLSIRTLHGHFVVHPSISNRIGISDISDIMPLVNHPFG
jgi:hypothetical protein